MWRGRWRKKQLGGGRFEFGRWALLLGFLWRLLPGLGYITIYASYMQCRLVLP